MRLSKDDGDKLESESISNQRNLIYRYAKDLNIIIVKEYIDDGYTGTNFDRPGFKEMIKDIECGIIDSILVKDLSRFARESIDSSNYIERYFPENNIRFIAILDNIDTYLDKMANQLVEFKLYNNQKFARDTSRKLRKSKRANMEKGLYMATYVAYGYKKDINNKGKILVDKESSKIVKKIFQMYLDGNSSVFIAKYLTDKKIKTPAQYIKIIPFKETNMYSVWKSTQILRILKNEVYIGNTVRNVENKIAYNKKEKRRTNRNEWIITKNTHEKIISEEEFYKVQELIKNKNGRNTGLKYNYLLRPYIYCGKCGRKVDFNTRSEKQVDLRCAKATYNCCEHYYYNYYKLEENILYDIKEYCKKICDFNKIEENVLNNKKSTMLNEIDKKVKKLLYEYNRINDNVDSLYIKKLDDEITEEEYKECMKEYNKKREDIDKKISEYNLIKNSFDEKSIKELKKIINEEKENLKNNISSELIDKLIYRIELSKSKVGVKYKFKFF